MHGIGKRVQPDVRGWAGLASLLLSLLFTLHLGVYFKFYYPTKLESVRGGWLLLMELYFLVYALSRWLGSLHSTLQPMPKITKFNYQQVYREYGRIAGWAFVYASALSIMVILAMRWLSEFRPPVNIFPTISIQLIGEWFHFRFFAPGIYLSKRENHWRERHKKTRELECYAFAEKIRKSH